MIKGIQQYCNRTKQLERYSWYLSIDTTLSSAELLQFNIGQIKLLRQVSLYIVRSCEILANTQNTENILGYMNLYLKLYIQFFIPKVKNENMFYSNNEQASSISNHKTVIYTRLNKRFQTFDLRVQWKLNIP